MTKQTHPFIAAVKDRSIKWAASFVVLSAVGMGTLLATPVGQKAIAIWQTDVWQIETTKTLVQIQETLADLQGVNRITRQPQGMSYVREPVTYGDEIVFVLFIGRTEVGAACQMQYFVPVFTDENQVVKTADRREARRQISTDVKPVQIAIQPPDGLAAGRTALHLQINYRCGDEEIYENTKTVFYYANS